MISIKCPDIWNKKDDSHALFLGGGISSCPIWQEEMTELLKPTNLILLNPRRDKFDMNDPKATEYQIKWEYEHLQKATARMFWFCHETLCPITLFELGKWCQKGDPLFVGAHPEYKRKIDLHVQLGLITPAHVVSSSLKELAERICNWSKANERSH